MENNPETPGGHFSFNEREPWDIRRTTSCPDSVNGKVQEFSPEFLGSVLTDDQPGGLLK